ncbi:MAG: histidinol dehydrogenase [Candidatus Omnitrophica bacterium]|nr:histidinol dehydrogenase [Candidatus Omnitrophota bacterium]
MKIVRIGSKQYEKLVLRGLTVKKRVARSVTGILDDIKANGDDAVLKYTRKFDRVKMKAKDLRVTQCEINGGYQDIKPEIVTTLKMVMNNINSFYQRNLKRSWKTKENDGVLLGERITPIDSVGVYVPSGTVPLVSSVYMSVLPAKMVGVPRLVMVSPPNKFGTIDPHILVMADLLEVNEIYKVGGAQAIGALAYGTKTIPRVNKIVGPGNEYVTEAKRQVFGYCDIDMLAGPSEVLVLANQYANPDYVIKDLLAQAEHHLGMSILVTPSKRLARIVRDEVDNGFIILTKNLDEAIDVANTVAPEHLEIMVRNPRNILKKIRNAGAIFIGPYTPVTIGDYVAGPSHVLPTGGTARFFSGLCVESFLKKSHIIQYSKKALEEVKEAVEKLTAIEHLPKHMDAVNIRFEK